MKIQKRKLIGLLFLRKKLKYIAITIIYKFINNSAIYLSVDYFVYQIISKYISLV